MEDLSIRISLYLGAYFREGAYYPDYTVLHVLQYVSFSTLSGCGHCKAMKPAYGEAAAQLDDEGVKGVLAAVEATSESQLAQRFDIKGYPTSTISIITDLTFITGGGGADRK